FLLGLSTRNVWGKGIAFLASALMVHTILIHNSRGAMLGLLVVGLLVFLTMEKRPRHLLVFALAVVVGLRLAGPPVWARFGTTFASDEERDTSAQSRLDLWADMLDAYQRHIGTGLGPDHWQLISHEYGWPRGKDGHGLWFQLAAELGTP